MKNYSETRHLLTAVFGLASCTAIFAPTDIAGAVSIVFEGTLALDERVTGEVPLGDGNSTNNPEDWDYWTFEGVAGSREIFTVRRLTAALDPAFGIWLGTETDTDAYRTLFSNSANTVQIASADDDIPELIPGPFSDAQVSVTLPETGIYTIAIASFISDETDEPLRYSLFRTVPLPDAALAVSTSLILGLGSLFKRKR